MKKRKIIIAMVVFLIFAISIAMAKSGDIASTRGDNQIIESAGYGVRNLSIANPLSSCQIVAPAEVQRGKKMTIFLIADYSLSQSATASFLHDGWHQGAHKYETSMPSFSWCIENEKGKELASGQLSNGSSIDYTPKESGKIQISCTARVTCTPSPSHAYVGITRWTETKMPVVTFQKKAKSIDCLVSNEPISDSDQGNQWDDETESTVVSHWLNPSVEHAALWNTRRDKYNESLGYDPSKLTGPIGLSQYVKKSEPRPRYSNVFWAGEKLILIAKADKYAKSIKATIGGTSYWAKLQKNDGEWQGFLWDSSMKDYWSSSSPSTAKIEFVAQYLDGTTLKRTVNVIFSGTTFSDILHRVA